MKDFIMMLLSVLLPVGLILVDKYLSAKEKSKSDARIKELETELAERDIEAKKATKSATVASNVLKSLLKHKTTQDENKKWAESMKDELARTMQTNSEQGNGDITVEEAIKISQEQVRHEENLSN